MDRGQLPLALSLDNEATFDNYYVPKAQQLLVSQVKAVAEGGGEKHLFLAGRTGRRHLLQACCLRAGRYHRDVRYIPLADVKDYPAAAVLEGADAADLLCLDNIDAIAGNDDWELALFSLYNQSLSSHCRLLFAAEQVPSAMAINLPDLASRLRSFSVYQLAELNDEERVQALQHRATALGMEMDAALAEYIYRRCQRDLHSLVSVLAALDRHSLAQQRRLTKPFVKEIMAW